MKKMIIVMLSGFAFVGCNPKDRQTTRLEVKNQVNSKVHATDCARGLSVSVEVVGHTYHAPLLREGETWEYDLVRGEGGIPYKLHVVCETRDGRRLETRATGELPSQSDDTKDWSGIVVEPPRLEKDDLCLEKDAAKPCIVQSKKATKKNS